ncbi:TOBE domain-containing protein [Helicobacter sp. Faydin-H64]|uniref:TOBE domain-containing protein n=1 Tax=Helicobacter turcicus TaxID=2867412 RepID=A0ABS7JM73_9HELI|nr:TOBE domain-containing protein [Helicobacter turcicus]MBX7490482.1 TOBE domain-containing protein [Helicobacter turcicus]MBX7545342.1 TOBE domain-containing protein [Helicobacter turcicus]
MQVKGRIWIKEQDKNFLGHGKIELLERIVKSGSISKAAKEMKMSYKAAWDSIDLMNKVASEPLVMRVTGGKGGGGTQVTQKGLEAIRIFREMERISEELYTLFEGDLETWDSMLGKTKESINEVRRNVLLKTSARNQLLGEILEIKEGAVNAEVTLKIKENMQIVSAITLHSLKELGLKVGMQAYALIKANWIVIFTQEPKGISLRNCLCGEISTLKEGAVNAEVRINCNGVELSAVVTEDSKETLTLKIGQQVWFGFKANNVILGI